MRSAEEITREVQSEIASWRSHRFCHARIARAAIVEIVQRVDPTRKPRVELVDDGHDAIRLRIRLHEDMQNQRDVDNARISRTAAAENANVRDEAYRVSYDLKLGGLVSEITAAAWATRTAIDDAFDALTADRPIAFQDVRHAFASPVYAFEHRALARLAGIEHRSTYDAVTDLYLAGCYPIGYVDDHFVVFAP